VHILWLAQPHILGENARYFTFPPYRELFLCAYYVQKFTKKLDIFAHTTETSPKNLTKFE
jgi:hypothetical protein